MRCLCRYLPQGKPWSEDRGSSALAPDLSRSRPADALVNNWIGGSSAAFDVTVTSPLTPVSLQESSVTAGTAALLAEQRSTRRMTPSVIPLDGNASLFLWRAMGTGVLKPGRLFPIWPRACPLA